LCERALFGEFVNEGEDDGAICKADRLHAEAGYVGHGGLSAKYVFVKAAVK
jgi:hypothetical protein